MASYFSNSATTNSQRARTVIDANLLMKAATDAVSGEKRQTVESCAAHKIPGTTVFCDECGKTFRNPAESAKDSKPVLEELEDVGEEAIKDAEASEGTKADVADLMESRSFIRAGERDGAECYQRGKNDRVLAIKYSDGVVASTTMTYKETSKNPYPDTRKGWKGLQEFASAYGD